MKSVNQAGDWRMHLRDMRTQNALREEAPSEDAVRRLSDRALMAAAQNPDHSEAARAAAAADLRPNGGNPDPWHVTAPAFIRPADLARGDRLFLGWGRGARALAGWSAVCAAVAALAVLAAQQVAPVLARWAPIGALLLAIAGGLAMLWGMASLLRLKPARVALLRPVASAMTNAPLRRMIAAELRPYGHVVSLAPGERGGAIRGATDYRARASALSNLPGMNFNALLGAEAMSLSAAAGWRPLVLDLLVTSSDVIVVDLSDGGIWAQEALGNPDVLKRCVFVSIWGKLDEAEAALRAHGIDAPCFHYAPDGEMQRRAAFRAAILAAMRATHGVSA